MADKNLNVYQRLAEVRKSVPYLKKEQKGSQYQYVGSSDVLGALHDKINEVGLMLIPEITGHKVTPYERVNAKGNTSNEYFTEIEMTMTWVNINNPEDNVSVKWYAQGVDLAGEKGVGKALTYGEKYFLLKTFNIATDKDDPDAFQEKVDAKKPTAKISERQIDDLNALAKEYAELRELPDKADDMLAWAMNQAKVKKLEAADINQAEAIRQVLQAVIIRAKKAKEEDADMQNEQGAERND